MKDIQKWNSFRAKHASTIREILLKYPYGDEAVEALTNYLMSRISTVISVERRKQERRLQALRSKNYGKKSTGETKGNQKPL